LVGSSALGQLGTVGERAQFNRHVGSTIETRGNAGVAGNLSVLGSADAQQSVSVYTTTAARQGNASLIVQGGLAANAPGGDVGITQNLFSDGINREDGSFTGPGQEQLVQAYDGTAREYQGSDVLATQDLQKSGGGGIAVAGQGIGQVVGQQATSTSVNMGQVSVVGGGQLSGIASAPGGTASVITTLHSRTQQEQIVNP